MAFFKYLKLLEYYLLFVKSLAHMMPGPKSDANFSVQPLEMTSLLQEVLNHAMNDCSLLVLVDDWRIFHSVAPMLQSYGRGTRVVSLNGLRGSDLLAMKRHSLQHDARVCLNYVIFLSADPPIQLFEAGVDFWRGKQKIIFIVSSFQEQTLATQILSNEALRRSSYAIVALKPHRLSNWSIYGGVLYKGHQRQGAEKINEWTGSKFLRKTLPLFDKWKYQNFEGYEFLISALKFVPFVIGKDRNQTGKERYGGIELDLLELMAQHANFTFNFTVPLDGQHGIKRPNGTWTGLIGMVGREEADLAIGHVVVSQIRNTYVDYSQTFIFDYQELITPKAKPLPAWQGPIRPFTGLVWALVGLSVLLAAAFLSGITYIYDSNKEDEWFRSFSNSLLFCVVELLTARHTRDYNRSFGRVFLGTWFVICMVISIFYRSSLTSFLIRPGFSKPIMNFDELLQTDLGFQSVQYGGYLNQLLASSTSHLGQALNRLIQWQPDLEGILDNIMAGKVACTANRITATMNVAVSYTDKFGQPMVTFTGQILSDEPISFPFAKDAPFKDRFNHLIGNIIESGLLDKFYQDELRAEKQRLQSGSKKKFVDVSEDPNSINTLNLGHFVGPFYIMLVGCGLGILAFIFELLWKIKN